MAIVGNEAELDEQPLVQRAAAEHADAVHPTGAPAIDGLRVALAAIAPAADARADVPARDRGAGG